MIYSVLGVEHLNTQSASRYCETSAAIMNYVIYHKNVGQDHWTLRNLEENISRIIVSTVVADGLAPLGARPSAGTMMTRFW